MPVGYVGQIFVNKCNGGVLAVLVYNSQSSSLSPISACLSVSALSLHIPNSPYLTSYESNAHKSTVSAGVTAGAVTPGTTMIKIIKRNV